MPFDEDFLYAPKTPPQSPGVVEPPSRRVDSDSDSDTGFFRRHAAVWRVKDSDTKFDRVRALAIHLFALTQRRFNNRPEVTEAEFEKLTPRMRADLMDLATGAIRFLMNRAPVDIREARLLGLNEAIRIAESKNSVRETIDAIQEEINKDATGAV